MSKNISEPCISTNVKFILGTFIEYNIILIVFSNCLTKATVSPYTYLKLTCNDDLARKYNHWRSNDAFVDAILLDEEHYLHKSLYLCIVLNSFRYENNFKKICRMPSYWIYANILCYEIPQINVTYVSVSNFCNFSTNLPCWPLLLKLYVHQNCWIRYKRVHSMCCAIWCSDFIYYLQLFCYFN